ncbi:MAG: RNA-binding protein [Verrucomicrobiales bacterium]|nr:RNA-binding protein [Verrucomicrobiales bacterium]|tara:strand:- start:13 stop:396 length:384 start_codon:yes stop_codon:yes gene_type:complete
MSELESIRIDKWLWAVRLYKTRTQATEACNAGHVKLIGTSVKPAREIRIGDEISAKTGRIYKTVRVVALLERRVGAKLVSGYLEDLTSAEEYERAKQDSGSAGPTYPKGLGRPTKKQRRQLKPFTEK